MNCTAAPVLLAMVLCVAPIAALAQPADRRPIAAVVDQLGSDDFFLREDAEKELRAIGYPALPLLRQAAAKPSAAAR